MEYTEGEIISNRAYLAKTKVNTAELCNRIEQMYSEMIFLKGTVHCDPHPGNILVRKTGSKPTDFEVVLLDHGLQSVNTFFESQFLHPLDLHHFPVL